MRRDRAGLTLVELLFAVVAMVIAGVALLGASQAGLHQIEAAQQTSLAMDHLHDMLERVKTTPFAVLNTSFPSGAPGGVVGGGPDQYGAIVGGYSPQLTGEQVTVTHSPSAVADPRELVVRVQWSNRGRVYQRTMSTLRTSQAL